MHTRTWAGAALVAVPALALLAAVAISSRFGADDWCAIGDVRQYGALGVPVHYYLIWSGRYTSNALWAAVGVFGPGLAWLVPTLGAGAFLAALWAAARRVGTTAPAILAVLALTVVVIVAPDRGEDFAWPTGAVYYVAGLTLVLLAVAAWDRPWLAAALALLAAGTSETLAAALVVVLAIGLRFGVPRVVFGAALVGLLVMAIAPGNAIRASLLPHPGLTDIAMGAIGAVTLYAVPLLGTLIAFVLTRRPEILIGLAGAVASFAPSILITAEPPPARALIVPVAFLFGAFAWLGLRRGVPAQLVPAFGAIAAILLLAAPPVLAGAETPWVADCIARAMPS